MNDLVFMLLGQMAFELLLGYAFRYTSTTSTDTLKDETKSHCVHRYMQVVLSFIAYGFWDSFRVLQVETGALISGACALGMFTVPNDNAPLEIFVAAIHAARVLQFFLDLGYVFKPSLPKNRWPSNRSAIIWLEEQLSNTVDTNRSTYTPMVNAALVANTYVLRNKHGHEVHVVSSNGTATDLVLNLHSTIYMNFISATHMVMLFPFTTLEKRVSIDFVLPQGSNSTIMLPYFMGDPVKVNPPLTALEVLRPASETNVFPRSVRDPSSLGVELPGIELPFGSNFPGSEEVVLSGSWQLGVSSSNVASINTVTYTNPSLDQTYTLAPAVHTELLRAQGGPMVAQVATSGGSLEDQRILSLLESITDDMSTDRFPYKHNRDIIYTQLYSWCKYWSALPPRFAPSAAVASSAFTVLNTLPSSDPSTVRVVLLCEPRWELGGRIWSALTVYLMKKPEGGAHLKEAVGTFEAMAMSVRLVAFDDQIKLKIEL